MLQRDEFAAYCDNRSAPPLDMDVEFEESDSESEDIRESVDSILVRKSIEDDLECNEFTLREIVFELSVFEDQLKMLKEQAKDQ